MEIKDVEPADAFAACQVPRRSILELHAADHKNDPGILGRWLATKTPESVASWIAKPDSAVLVAVKVTIYWDGYPCRRDHARIMSRRTGAFNRGSRTLTKAFEAIALKWDNRRGTWSARRQRVVFTTLPVYTEAVAPPRQFGTDPSYPMTKDLVL